MSMLIGSYDALHTMALIHHTMALIHHHVVSA
jgi:hypothetical protein